MKILKKGRAQKGWSKEFVCTGDGNGRGGCGAKLLVSKEDLYKTYHYYYDGDRTIFTTFTCPCCGVKTDVTVPSSVEIFESEKDYLKSKEEQNENNG